MGFPRSLWYCRTAVLSPETLGTDEPVGVVQPPLHAFSLMPTLSPRSIGTTNTLQEVFGQVSGREIGGEALKRPRADLLEIG